MRQMRHYKKTSHPIDWTKGLSSKEIEFFQELRKEQQEDKSPHKKNTTNG